MITILFVALVLLFGLGRVSPLLLALACLSAFVIAEPALLATGPAAFVVVGAFLLASIRWAYPTVYGGIQPVRVLWVTQRFTLALAYA